MAGRLWLAMKRANGNSWFELLGLAPLKAVLASNRNLLPLAQPIKGQRCFVSFGARAPTSGRNGKHGMSLTLNISYLETRCRISLVIRSSSHYHR